jgi:hypothetical protein
MVSKKLDLPNVVYTKGLEGFSGIVIGSIIVLDILFFSFYIWIINESCSLISSCVIIWGLD